MPLNTTLARSTNADVLVGGDIPKNYPGIFFSLTHGFFKRVLLNVQISWGASSIISSEEKDALSIIVKLLNFIKLVFTGRESTFWKMPRALLGICFHVCSSVNTRQVVVMDGAAQILYGFSDLLA